MKCVVDTEGDSVRCFLEKAMTKNTTNECGTAVSVLVPVSLTKQRFGNGLPFLSLN
jgi:hypothetical protein